MPTASEYRNLALRLQQLSDSTAREARRVERDLSEVCCEGPVRVEAETQAGCVHAKLSELQREVAVQVAEAERRAEICDQYTKEMNEYRNSDDEDATPPTLAASWVSYG